MILPGCDLSRWQPPTETDYVAMASDGIRFCFIQLDDSSPEHIAKCKDSPIRGIGYGFLMLTQPIKPQIEGWAERISRGGLPFTLALDCEHNPPSVPIDARPAMYSEAAQQTIEILGTQPLIYTYPAYDDGKWPDDFGAFPLWLAAPRPLDVPPDPYPKLFVPKPWAAKGPLFHQWTDDNTVVRFVKGYPGHALLDRFFGSEDDLQALLDSP